MSLQPEMMRGRNSDGLCVRKDCPNPADPEMCHGYGPMIYGYLCSEHGKQFAVEQERIQTAWQAEDDAQIIKALLGQ